MRDRNSGATLERGHARVSRAVAACAIARRVPRVGGDAMLCTCRDRDEAEDPAIGFHPFQKLRVATALCKVRSPETGTLRHDAPRSCERRP